MSQFSLDPWPESHDEPEPFTLGYKKGTAEPVVLGSFLLAAALLGTGIVSGMLLPVLASLPVFFSVYWQYPFIDKRPQMGANKTGLYLERLGVIRWSAIKGLSIQTTAVRSMEFRQLCIQLKGPIEECLHHSDQKSLLRAAMRKNWRLNNGKSNAPVIELDLNLLACDPEILLQRTRQFYQSA
ncbi:hypothetical protein PsAD2_02360 [Pseudovibrio axinellae]|uniref:Uncharacterized protein n=1 Tax=Pseudovibrio axinellae TaxID=989403 RepID=A0A165YHD8_9HYPH|nr:hypothetical protein [Pseudovibrio axinellae]KZL18844.1 hypothetical protein PsAD2_02360 [Pseudovibrio axinellae]SEP90671.1 hypothetical protein SAMN05421798_101681 [Pseudovibrio axinellae]